MRYTLNKYYAILASLDVLVVCSFVYDYGWARVRVSTAAGVARKMGTRRAGVPAREECYTPCREARANRGHKL